MDPTLAKFDAKQLQKGKEVLDSKKKTMQIQTRSSTRAQNTAVLVAAPSLVKSGSNKRSRENSKNSTTFSKSHKKSKIIADQHDNEEQGQHSQKCIKLAGKMIDLDNDDDGSLEARNYQIKLMEVAIKKNTIIYLPTGSGKTFIAVMVMKQLCGELLNKPYDLGGKICIMVVNTVTLVDQHLTYLRRFTPFNVGGYSGDMNVDFWSEQAWEEEFHKNQVLIMTSQILLNIIETSIISLNRVHLLIFDECHHGVNDHSMRQIMLKFENLTDPPRVLGLTATLLNRNCKPHQVVDEVRGLETTYHSTVATVDELRHVLGYSTNPREWIRIFRAHESSQTEKNVIMLLEELILIVQNVKPVSPARSPPKSHLKYLGSGNTFNDMVRLIKDTIVHISELGIFGGRLAIVSHLIQFERLRKNCQDAQYACVVDCVITQYLIAQKGLEKAMENYSPIDKIYQFSANQLIELFNVLDEYRASSKQSLCGIIFVKRRFTAKILYHIFLELSQVDPRFDYVKPNFVVGYNSNPFVDTRESLYNAKMQKKVMAQFHSKEVNLLISSNVLEEGIDIPLCSLVIKFDKPSDYRSYMQSKGRARHKDSIYGVLVSNTESNTFMEKYEVFKKVENLLNEFLIGKTDRRKGPTPSNINDFYQESELPPYYTNGPDSAMITMVSAISLLCRYCASLPSDKYTTYAPNWFLNDGGNPIRYQVVIELPLISPIMKPIEGPFMLSKKLAKRAAALLGCKLLHKTGEIDDNLNPKSHEVLGDDVSHLFHHWPEDEEKDSGIHKKKRVHLLKIPQMLIGKIEANTTLYLHIIEFQPNVVKNNLNTPGLKMMYNMYTSSTCFGLLTLKKLPQLCEFSFFVSLGEIVVNFDVNKKTVVLSAAEIMQLRVFHAVIFKDILKILKTFLVFDNSKSADGILVVPIRKNINYSIDFEVIQNHSTVVEMQDEPSEKERAQTEVTEENYLGKIVTPWYRRDEQLYLVTSIALFKNAYTEFPSNDFNTYADYYKEKYSLTVYTPSQPLLLVKSVSKKMNCLKPRGNKKRDKEKNYDDMEEHLVAEFCVQQTFPATLWIQSFLLPSFLHRMLGLLQAYELREIIAKETGIGVLSPDHQWKALVIDNNLADNESVSVKKHEQKVLNVSDPDETVVQIPNEALQQIKSDFVSKKLDSEYPWEEKDEPVDIERHLHVTPMDIQYYDSFIAEGVGMSTRKKRNLPMRGNYPAIGFDRNYVENKIALLQTTKKNVGPELVDILQAITTVKANDIVNLERMETLGDSFLKLSISVFIILKYPKYDEGKATTLKCKLISNKNLYYVGVNKKLNGYLHVSEFTPTYEWKPPSFCVPSFIAEKIESGDLDPAALMKIFISHQEQLAGEVLSGTKSKILDELSNVEKKSEISYDSLLTFVNKRVISDKTVADSVEALIGTYFLSSGFEGGLKLMEWLDIIPKSGNLPEIFNITPPSPVDNSIATHRNINFMFPSWQMVEELLGYHFNNRAYLLQAFTHSSYTTNRLTGCYQRLEFLGDAVLDFLITCHIFETCEDLNPGQLTDLRSSLVNNIIFAAFTVRCGFHKFMLFYNNKLLEYIDNFVQYQESRNHIIDDEILILLQEDDLYLAEHIDVPKTLGDIFEALAGAVYLDSGLNLNAVWTVFHRIMWKEIEQFKTNIPKNIVRTLHETPGAHPHFQVAVPVTVGRVMVPLDFMLNGVRKRVFGFGENKTFAKKAASKIALRLLSSD